MRLVWLAVILLTITLGVLLDVAVTRIVNYEHTHPTSIHCSIN
jgi:hypothetical protein